MNAKKELGFIGLGIMGKAMAHNLLAAGYPLTVYDLRLKPMKELETAGAATAGSSREVAERSDTIFIMVPDSPDVEEVILGGEGLLEGVREGATVIISCTIAPSMVERLAEKTQEKGVRMLDAPVSGGQSGAQNGTLAIYVGGEEALFEECLPFLEAMGDKVFHIGPLGHGMILKLVNNLIAFINLEALNEGLVLGMKSGLNPDKMLKALSIGSSYSWIMESMAERILERRFKPPSARMKNAHKTMRIILDVATYEQVPLPAAGEVYQLMTAMKATGREDLDMSALITVLEDMADFEADRIQNE